MIDLCQGGAIVPPFFFVYGYVKQNMEFSNGPTGI
jgi:hypothetical protein